MTQSVKILCVNKSRRVSPNERIRNVGGRNANGTAWLLAEDQAIAMIEDGTYTFYINVGGRTQAVHVAETEDGRKFLKTVSDTLRPDNLLGLPECLP